MKTKIFPNWLRLVAVFVLISLSLAGTVQAASPRLDAGAPDARGALDAHAAPFSLALQTVQTASAAMAEYPPPTTAELQSLEVIRSRMITDVGQITPTAYAISQAAAYYDSLGITVTDGTISGPVCYTDTMRYYTPTNLTLVTVPVSDLPNAGTVNFVWALANASPSTENFTKAINFAWLCSSQGQPPLIWYQWDYMKALWRIYTQCKANATCSSSNQPAFNAIKSYLATTYLDTMATRACQTDDLHAGLQGFFISSLAYSGTSWGTADSGEQVQNLRDLKAFLDRMLQYTEGTSDCMKRDGTTFHHWTHYPAYMYAYNTFIKYLYYLKGTAFQIDLDSYLRLRDTMYALSLYLDPDIIPVGLSGRHPFENGNPVTQDSYRKLAELGGEILGIDQGSGCKADPLIAGYYRRMWPTSTYLTSCSAESFPVGFWQSNYGAFGVYRQAPWYAVLKGLNSMAWGTEIYVTANRYGRYQSYGSIDVIYPGGTGANGQQVDGWDWNRFPGTTSIELSSADLKAQTDRQDERTDSPFAGALAIDLRPDGLLGIEGNAGLFAMDFTQRNNSLTHNPTFKFTKSVFATRGRLIALGSNIANNDAQNPTISTLFQRFLSLTKPQPDATLGTQYLMMSESADPITSAWPEQQVPANGNGIWLIDSKGTGYWVKSGDPVYLKWQNQSSPQEDGSANTLNGDVASAWIDHGTSPTGASYEYVVIPGANREAMEAFRTRMQDPSTAEYVVHQQDQNAHIIEDRVAGLMAYALFTPNTALPSAGFVRANDYPVLLATRQESGSRKLWLANPNLGIPYWQYTPSQLRPVHITIDGLWTLGEHSDGVSLASDANTTVLTFNTKDGLPLEAVLLDETAPIANASALPAANAAGWNNSDVTVTWNWADEAGGTGIDPANCTATSTSSGEGAITLSATCKDRAGNTGSATFSVNVDKTKPTITSSRSPDANANGWNNTDVAVSFSCADDGGSGIASCAGDTVLENEAANQQVVGQTLDNAGNQASAIVSGINIDKTAPVAVLDSTPANLANNTSAAFAFHGTDPTMGGAASGVNHLECSLDGGAFATCTSPKEYSSLSASNHTFAVRAIDNAGNTGDPASFAWGVDTAAPVASNVLANPNPVPLNAAVTLNATVSDADHGNVNIASASYTVDGGTPVAMTAQDGSFNSPTEDVTANLGVFAAAGVHNLCVQGQDVAGNASAPECTLLAVYDPSAGFVTGGGWIISPIGASVQYPDAVGKANFGFVSKYEKGKTVPTGETEFQFKAGNLNFHSAAYDWLVVAGAKAQYKGTGTINGAGNYGFMLTAIDGQVNGGGGVDKFRIKIWDKATGNIVYDNQMNAPDTADPTTALGGGSIVIHSK